MAVFYEDRSELSTEFRYGAHCLSTVLYSIKYTIDEIDDVSLKSIDRSLR